MTPYFQKNIVLEEILPFNLAFVVHEHKLKGDVEESV